MPENSPRSEPEPAEPLQDFEPWSVDPSIPKEVGVAGARQYVNALRLLGVEPSNEVLEAADLPLSDLPPERLGLPWFLRWPHR